MTLLAEIPEDGAAGTVARTYDDIRAVFAVPFVVLVYRALAVVDRRLEGVWATVRPNLLDPEAQGQAAAIAPAAPAPPPGAGDLALRAAATLDAFDRVNRRNAVVLSALLHGHDAPDAPVAPAAPAPTAPTAILPRADPAALPPALRARLERVSGLLAGDERPVVIPTLLRHLASDVDLLDAVLARLERDLPGERHRADLEAIDAAVRAAARALPYAVPPAADAGTRAIVVRFARTIPAMVAAAPLIGAAIAQPA